MVSHEDIANWNYASLQEKILMINREDNWILVCSRIPYGEIETGLIEEYPGLKIQILAVLGV